MNNIAQIFPIIIFLIISGLIGYFISLLLSKIHTLMIFFIPVFFILLGGLLFVLGAFDLLNAGWGNIALLIYAMVSLLIGASNIISSIILYYKKRSNQ
jgi:hypothetical protein